MSEQLEDRLRQTLRRKEPPPGFAHRVMARLPVTMPQRRRAPGAWRWLAAVAACLMVVAGIDRYQEHRRGVEARQQLMLALEITGKKLAVVQNKVDELNRRSVLQ
jgi:hypothetical protein